MHIPPISTMISPADPVTKLDQNGPNGPSDIIPLEVVDWDSAIQTSTTLVNSYHFDVETRVLKLDVRHTGTESENVFKAIWNGYYVKTSPAQADVYLMHEISNPVQEIMLMSRELELDLSSFGDFVTVNLHVTPDETIEIFIPHQYC